MWLAEFWCISKSSGLAIPDLNISLKKKLIKFEQFIFLYICIISYHKGMLLKFSYLFYFFKWEIYRFIKYIPTREISNLIYYHLDFVIKWARSLSLYSELSSRLLEKRKMKALYKKEHFFLWYQIPFRVKMDCRSDD